MSRTDDAVVALLLVHLRRATADRVRACREEALRRGETLVVRAGGDRLVSTGELCGLQEAARYLISGNHLHACPKAHVQLVAQPGFLPACPTCGAAFLRGVLPSWQAVRFDPALERQVRRLILDATARARTQECVREAKTLRDAGALGRRPEEELAPRARAPRPEPAGEAALGPYSLLELVGRGSSSYVYRALDRRDGRTVALKVLYFQEGEAQAVVSVKRARFEREAALASRLDHPNLIPAGALETHDGWWCIPMAFVDGPTLAQLLEARAAAVDAGTAPPAGSDARALALALCDVARGLHYAHCQGIVHRDVNPRNILFTAAGQALLGDFGTARPLEGGQGLTAQKAVLGAIDYAAPERLLSESNAGPASDVWALGVILYEILAGRRPFSAVNPAILIGKIQSETPAPPSTLGGDAPLALDAAALRALDAAALRALARDAHRRFASALEFAEAVAAAAGPEDSPASAPASSWISATSWKTAAAAATIALGLGFAAGAAWSKRAPAAGAVAAQVGTPAAQFALAAAAESEGEYRERRRRFEDACAACEREHGRASPEALLWRGRRAWSQGRAAEAEDAFARAASADGESIDARLGRALALLSIAERRAGSAYDAVRAAAEVELHAIPRASANAWEGRLAAALLQDLGGATDLALEALARLAAEAPARPEPGVQRALILLRGGRRSEALQAIEPLERCRRFDPQVRAIRPIAMLGDVEPDQVLAEARPLTALWPGHADLLLVEAAACVLAGRPEEAQAAAERALRADPEAIDGWRLLARAQSDQDRPRAATEALSHVLELHPRDSRARIQRGKLYFALEDRDRAAADLQTVLELFPDAADAAEVRLLLRRAIGRNTDAATAVSAGRETPSDAVAASDGDGDGQFDAVRFRGGLEHRFAPGTPGFTLGFEADAELFAAATDSRAIGRGPADARPRLNPLGTGVPLPPAAGLRAIEPAAGGDSAGSPRCAWPAPFSADGLAMPEAGAPAAPRPDFEAALRPDGAGNAADGDPSFPMRFEDLTPEARAALAYYEEYSVAPRGQTASSFRLRAPERWQALPAPSLPGEADRSVLCLLHLQSPDGAPFAAPVTIQVHVLRLLREVDAESWLALYVARAGLRPLRGQTLIGACGPVPDWLAVDARGGKRGWVRLTAFKDGGLIYLLAGRAEAADYPQVAAAFAVAALTWEPGDPGGHRYAEDLTEWKSPNAPRLTFQHTASWREVVPARIPPGMCGTTLRRERSGEARGTITVRAVDRERHDTLLATDLLDQVREELLREHGITPLRTVERVAVRSARFPGEGWVEVLEGTRSGRGFDLRIVVLQRDKRLYAVSLAGPAQAADAEDWAQNRRALEIVLRDLND